MERRLPAPSKWRFAAPRPPFPSEDHQAAAGYSSQAPRKWKKRKSLPPAGLRTEPDPAGEGLKQKRQQICLWQTSKHTSINSSFVRSPLPIVSSLPFFSVRHDGVLAKYRRRDGGSNSEFLWD